MDSILSTLNYYFGYPKLPIPPIQFPINAPATKPAENIALIENLKTIDFSKITNAEQCKEIHMACLKEGRVEWMKGAGYYTAAVLSGALIIITAVFLSKVATFLFAFYLLPLSLFGPLSLTSLVSTDLSTALLAFYSATTIWTKLEEKARPHWEGSEHFYSQAKQAEEKYFKLVKQAQ